MGNIIEIKDFLAPELDVFARLTEAQLRNRLEADKGIFIAESPKVINTALDAGYIPVSLLMDRKHIAGQGAAVIERCGDIPVYTADDALLANLAGYPLAGDWLYGTEDKELIARPALHSCSLRFAHPLTGEQLSFTAPLPEDMAALLKDSEAELLNSHITEVDHGQHL